MTGSQPSGRLRRIRLGSGRGAGSEPPLDVRSWSGALVVMLALTAALWIVQIVNASEHYSLDRFGLRPRHVSGLWGVLMAPVLQRSYGHLLSDSVLFVAIGWVLLLSGLRTWVIVTAVVLVLGGLATWALAGSGLVLGPSGLVFGWIGYLIARAYFSRRIRWIAVALAVLFFFGSILSGVIPSVGSGVSWQFHACSFVAGILAGAVLHPRRRTSGNRAAARRGPVAG